jgi:hypothetical protein
VGALSDCLGPKPNAPPPAEGVIPPPVASPATLNLIVELLCFCVKSHSYRIKYYVLRNNVVEKVLKLTQRPERFLVVAAVRFLRTCIGLKVRLLLDPAFTRGAGLDPTVCIVRHIRTARNSGRMPLSAPPPPPPRTVPLPSVNVSALASALLADLDRWVAATAQDEFYHRYLTKNNLFEPVMTAFQTNGNRYNLLNSAVLEMVDFIKRENIKSLVAHLVEHFGDSFLQVDYINTFQVCYETAEGLCGPLIAE